MNVDDAEARLRHMLVTANFNFARPDPALAWNVFKLFVAESSNLNTAAIWFEAGDGILDHNSPAYFDYVIMFTQWNGRANVGEQLTAHFTAPATVSLGLHGVVHANNVHDLSTWFDSVEDAKSFQIGLLFTGWKFELRIDGC